MKPIRRAFTLIELLVVIAIIAILAAILFPVFAQARESARQSACLSNVRQMGNAITMYETDFDERLPMFVALTVVDAQNGVREANNTNIRWWKLLDPYCKNRGIFKCPSHPGFHAANDVVTYDWNQWYSGPDHLAQFKSVASIILICDRT